MMKKEKNQASSKKWDTVITSKRAWFDLRLAEIWHYRDLIFLFVKRDFVANYVQTILGPLWFIAQPLFSAVIYTIVFNKIARIPTDGIPPFLFYMAGSTVWSYFASCLQNTSKTLLENASMFSKVYFPRLNIPLATVISSIGKFTLNFILFLGFLIYFILSEESQVKPNWYICFLPLIVLQMALLGLGCGVLVSALSSKYRDLEYLMGISVQLWMYVTPVIYPLSQVPEAYRGLYMLNPMVAVIEFFRFCFIGQSSITLAEIALSWIVSLFILMIGILVFNRIERNFVDTI